MFRFNNAYFMHFSLNHLDSLPRILDRPLHHRGLSVVLIYNLQLYNEAVGRILSGQVTNHSKLREYVKVRDLWEAVEEGRAWIKERLVPDSKAVHRKSSDPD